MSDLKGRVSVGTLFSTDEEIGGFTTAMIVSKGCLARRLVIVLDADQYGVTVEEKGVAVYQIQVTGLVGHLDKTEGRGNSIETLMDGFLRFRESFENAKSPDEWGDVFCPVAFKAGDSAYRMPQQAEMAVKILYRKPGDSMRYFRQLEAMTGGRVTLLRDCTPVRVDAGHPLISDMLDRMSRQWPGRSILRYRLNGATDARHMTQMNVPMLLIGMDASGAHSSNERLRIASYNEYRILVERYLLDHFGGLDENHE